MAPDSHLLELYAHASMLVMYVRNYNLLRTCILRSFVTVLRYDCMITIIKITFLQPNLIYITILKGGAEGA